MIINELITGIMAISILVTLFLGIVIIILRLNKKNSLLQIENAVLREKAHEVNTLKSEIATKTDLAAKLNGQIQAITTAHDKDKKYFQQQLNLVNDAKENLNKEFTIAAKQALENNNKNFLQLAKQSFQILQKDNMSDMKQSCDTFAKMVEPVKHALEKVDEKILNLEKARVGAYSALMEKVKDMSQAQQQITIETTKLSQALRSPTVRGRWGEMQLRRVVEISGLNAHCDFIEQPTINNDNEKDNIVRPDMIIQLPGDKSIIIDAKVPLQSYLQAIESSDPQEHKKHMQNHAKHIKNHVNVLGSKNYWQNIKSAEFVVLFLPGDIFFNTALEYEPTLIEEGMAKNVIIATPSTLIALLHAVAYSWRQQNITQNCKEIEALGRQMYTRICDMNLHFTKLGASLNNAVVHYNRTIGTISTRIVPSLRKFEELGVSSGKSLEEIPQINQITRELKLTASNKA